MNTLEASVKSWSGPLRVFFLLLAELLVIHYARHAFHFECHTERYGFCGVARNALLASYSLAAVFTLLGLFAREAARDLLSETDIRHGPLALNLSGLAVLLVSLLFVRGELSVAGQITIYAVWGVSAGMALTGAVLMIAPLFRWRAFGNYLGWRLPFAVLAGITTPFIAIQVRPFWQVDFLADQTFRIVTWLLAAWGQPLEPHEGDKVIGAEGFFINVAPSCSGIEGIVLTTAFSLIYLALFRRELRFPQALAILPVALLASWLLNGVRIALLVQLGISGYPELAVGGFHSHAGWLMFTLLSLSIVLVTQSTGLFRVGAIESAPYKAPPPFFSDPAVARILPFAVFMFSALLASVMAQSPGLVYPVRVGLMAGVLALFWRLYLKLDWEIQPVAVLSGLLVGLAWVTIPVAPGEAAPPFGDLSGPSLLIWIILRVVGTVLLVPIIEELFFRDYLESRLRVGTGKGWDVSAALISAALFAVLHDRWAEAFFAGLVFSWVMRRTGSITAAIYAHAVANLVVISVAIFTGNWQMV